MSSQTPAASQDFVDAPTQPETRGIEVVSPSERHGRARDLFGVWAAPNVSILNFTIGATMILLGLEIWQAVAVIVAANLLWVFPGLIAIAGPAAGTSGSVISRALYGIIGNKVIIAFTGWLVSAVFLALNWLASSFMGADLLAQWGFADPVFGPVAVTLVVSAITVLVAVYGHGLIIKSYTAISIGLLVIFLAVTAFALPTVDWGYQAPEALTGVPLWSAITIGFTILASTPLSYINSPDIARYLPRETKPSHIIAATALGGALPGIFFTVVGALIVTGLTGPQLEAGIESAILGLLPTWLGPPLVLAVIVNTIALNGMTTYTSSMALQSVGVPIRRIPSAIVIGVIGTALTLYLVMSTNLLDAVNLMLQFLVIVSGPAMAIFATDIVLRRNRYDATDLFDEERGGRYWYTAGWSIPGMTSVVVGGIATAACLSTDVWTGPVSEAMGWVDLSVPVGMIVSALVYLGLSKTGLGRFEEVPTARAAQVAEAAQPARAASPADPSTEPAA
ncbi:cytosine permease [Agromyces sp. H3Y2-19a]|uniref:purine-cytosine permease family protein n=1 Tax=Agromyces chromiiresistens TaxID=3030835 RepID=UPI0023B93470|nr:cytosine permease [Agromyces chromiiresistens]MDF0514333.1 cytosine permease [Agromyces chromiiresistens]